MWSALAILGIMGGLLLWSFRAGKKTEQADTTKEALDAAEDANKIRSRITPANARDVLRGLLG